MKLPKWPFALKSTVRRLQLENYTLRDALREANNEIRRHRKLLGELTTGSADILERVTGKKK